ncbi:MULTISPECIES: hypothetical protein [unclassified Streptomyces]|uniref:hypothetical protein n=1 Tax=unclassified Streptomyces TaxID=2593676 RepID=UPI000CD4D720|nr:hypothetical protein [Streptomyces sp. SM10]
MERLAVAPPAARTGLEVRVRDGIRELYAPARELRNAGVVILSGAPGEGWRVLHREGRAVGPDDSGIEASGPAGEAVEGVEG